MERVYLVIRCGDCDMPAGSEAQYNQAKNAYIVRLREDAKTLALDLIQKKGGEWLVFQLVLIGNATMSWSVPTSP